MIKSYSKQTGSAHIIIIVVLAVALLGTVGFVFWQNFTQSKDTTGTVNVPKEENKQNADMLVYHSDPIGIEFTYPKDWIKVECDNTYPENNPLNKVYFGTTNEGLGIADGKSTQLCGGGSDFPPQMAFSLRENIDEGLYLDYAESATDVMIDGVRAKKYAGLTDSKSIMPGLESTTYLIKKTSSLYITASYNRFPEITSGSRDNSEATKQKFIDVVEKSLRLL
jgi:hypothetical protein